MNQEDAERLQKIVTTMAQLTILQIEAQMNLATAILHIEGISAAARDDAYKAFTGIQDQLDLLKQIQSMDASNDDAER